MDLKIPFNYFDDFLKHLALCSYARKRGAMQMLASTAELNKSGGVLSEDKHILWEKAFCLPEPTTAVFQSSLKPLAQTLN